MKKTLLISLILVSILTTFSLSSFAQSPYDSIPYVDGTSIKQFTTGSDIKDIAASDSGSLVINRAGTLYEYNTGNMASYWKIGKVSGLENIDYTSNNNTFGVIGSDNDTRRIYFDCMNTSTNYVSYPDGVGNIYAINAKTKWELGVSGQYEATLYVDVNTPSKYYGYKITEYRFDNYYRTWSYQKEYSTSYTERGDFAYVNESKIVGISGYYWPIFFTKSEIDATPYGERGIPAGYNCHGFIETSTGNTVVIKPSKLTYGNGNYYAIVSTSNAISIVKLPENRLVF